MKKSIALSIALLSCVPHITHTKDGGEKVVSIMRFGTKHKLLALTTGIIGLVFYNEYQTDSEAENKPLYTLFKTVETVSGSTKACWEWIEKVSHEKSEKLLADEKKQRELRKKNLPLNSHEDNDSASVPSDEKNNTSLENPEA